jgi:hypothetical protein
MQTKIVFWFINLNFLIMNIVDLRNDLIKTYQEQKNKMIDNKSALVSANIAGKIMNTAALQIKYSSMMGTKETIKFLEQ